MESNKKENLVVKIQLRPEQVKFIFSELTLPSNLKGAVKDWNFSKSGGADFSIDTDSAERFREFFFCKLAEVGFDENYDPNSVGKMLEELNDAFATWSPK